MTMLAAAEKPTQKKPAKKGVRNVRVLEYRKDKTVGSKNLQVARLLIIDEEEEIIYEYPPRVSTREGVEITTAARERKKLDKYIEKLVPTLLPDKKNWRAGKENFNFLMERGGFKYYREFPSKVRTY
ncbi:MAG: hypothetical protein R3251_03825 [Candidatus Spechtbacterales bacterium]|nr:hypothetical protein [Candidatus Spechtbacterales bacterium]